MFRRPSLLAAAVVLAVALAGASGGAPTLPASSVTLVAVDADPGGNGPRVVGSVQSCVSAKVGQPVAVDIVVPGPGIPADRGVAAYQFRLFYDPAIVWIDGEDSKLLLAQAAGSTVIAIADPTPHKTGDYLSVAADFGAKGVEPAGASEVGPGVLARLTLLPRTAGTSVLTLTDVEIAADDSSKIALAPVQSASIVVGGPCAGVQGLTTGPSPTPAAPSAPAAAASAPSERAASAPSVRPAAGFADTGGPPPPGRDASLRLIALGLAASLGGAALVLRWRFPRRG